MGASRPEGSFTNSDGPFRSNGRRSVQRYGASHKANKSCPPASPKQFVLRRDGIQSLQRLGPLCDELFSPEQARVHPGAVRDKAGGKAYGS
jgi:hypothetical protein